MIWILMGPSERWGSSPLDLLGCCGPFSEVSAGAGYMLAPGWWAGRFPGLQSALDVLEGFIALRIA